MIWATNIEYELQQILNMKWSVFIAFLWERLINWEITLIVLLLQMNFEQDCRYLHAATMNLRLRYYEVIDLTKILKIRDPCDF